MKAFSFPLIFCLILPVAHAGIFERSADLRTTIPEFIVRDQIWGFQSDIGATYNSGNVQQVSANAYLNLFRRLNAWIFFLEGKYYFFGTGDPTTKVQNQGSILERVDYLITDAWSVFFYNSNAYNEFLDLTYRGTLAAGVWLQSETETITNGLSAAAAYEFEQFKSDASIARTGRLILRDVFSVKMSKTSFAGFDFIFAPAFADFNDYRLVFAPFIEAGLIPTNSISLKLSLIFERDSMPRPGIRNNDLELVTSLTFRFGE